MSPVPQSFQSQSVPHLTQLVPTITVSDKDSVSNAYNAGFHQRILSGHYNTDAFFDAQGRLSLKKLKQRTTPTNLTSNFVDLNALSGFQGFASNPQLFTQTTKNFNTHHITIHNTIRAATASKQRPKLSNSKTLQKILKQQIEKLTQIQSSPKSES